MTQINLFRETLASNSDDALKSYDLVWLLHLVGDVHQPLHCTARFTKSFPNGDGGGNGVTVCESSCRSLHEYWDQIFGTTMNPKTANFKLNQLSAIDPDGAADLTTQNWINQNFEIAKKWTYAPPVGKGKKKYYVSETYRKNAIYQANQLVKLGGLRLGRIIDRELK